MATYFKFTLSAYDKVTDKCDHNLKGKKELIKIKLEIKK